MLTSGQSDLRCPFIFFFLVKHGQPYGDFKFIFLIDHLMVTRGSCSSSGRPGLMSMHEVVNFGNALQAASWRGYEDIVKLLL